MNDLLAGIISGFIMGMVFVGAGAIMLPAYHSELDNSLRNLSSRFLRSVLAVSFVVLVLVAWSLFGLLAVRLYRWAAFNFPASGFGTPNLLFTGAVVLIALVMTLNLFLTQRKGIWERLIMNAGFAVIFGWLLPLLAR